MICSFSPFGYEGSLVVVEVDLRRGIPAVDIVGFADSCVKDTRERVRNAIQNSSLEFPSGRALISLSPADLKKNIPFDLPIAIEFRHKSWFAEEFKEGTLQFLSDMHFINVVVDQPQTPDNSVPFVPVVTNTDLAFMRLHGRNYAGWLGDDAIDWRTFRTLYDYPEEELAFL